MSGIKKLARGEYLFREGDVSDAMYVIKKGSLEVTKSKGPKEIVLATLKQGEMVGEMAFFDSKPRSAGARAERDTEVIVLPFSALYAQFKTFPEWLKAMVKTVNSHLRNANLRIKNLESAQADPTEMFPPHTITRLIAIISYMGYKCGDKEGDGLVVPYNTLRNYTIQVFQQPTNKLDRIMEVLQGLGHIKVEELGEGKKKVTIIHQDLLSQFVDWYNKYLFTEESKQVTVVSKEMPALKALLFYSKDQAPNKDGKVVVNLTEVQASAMRDINQMVGVADYDSLVEKKIIDDKQSGDGGIVTAAFNRAEIERIYPFWEMVHVLTSIPARGA